MSMLALAAAIAASALTAPLEEIYNDAPVVTNVTFEGLATTAQVDAEVAAATNAATRAAVSAAKDYADGATNRMATALRGEIAAAKPADYEAVKAKAESALQPAATNGVPEALVSHASLLSSLSSTVAAHEADTSNPHGVTAAQVGAYTKKEADTKMSAASNALARAVAEIDGRTTNYVTRAEVTPEYNEDGTPTGAAARAAYAGEAYRSTNTDSAYESVLLCAVFNSYGDENEYRKIKYDLEAKAWSVWDRDVSSVRVKGVRSLLQPDGSPFATSNMVTGALAPYAKTADLPTVPAKVSALQNDAGYVTQSVTNGLATALGDYKTKTDRAIGELARISTRASNHMEDTSNPHDVTAAQVGAYTKTEIDAKGFLTAHQPLTNCATKAELSAKQDRPAAPIAATALAYRPDGAALSVTVAASASLAAELAGWTEGQAQTALVTLAAGASVDPGVRLVGYAPWPTNRFLASCVRVGTIVYVTPVTTLSE